DRRAFVATRSGSSRHLFKIGEPDPVPYLAPEVVRDAQVAWNALARLAFQMDTVQLEPQVALVLDPTPPVMPPELYGPLRSIASDDGLCPLAVIRALA